MVSYENFTAVNGRCAVDMGVLLTQLMGECGSKEVLAMFDDLGISYAPVDVAGIALSLRNTATYRSGARMIDAPRIFDCSSFTKYCYALSGIWIPRLSIQQFQCGLVGSIDSMFPGDLVFFTGPVNCWVGSPENGVGHVGIYVGDGRVVHATSMTGCVTESPLARLMKRRRSTRGTRRIIREGADTLVLRVPVHLELETSDDILWLVRRHLGKRRPEKK